MSKITLTPEIALEALRANDTPENLEALRDALTAEKDKNFNVAVYALLDLYADSPSAMFAAFLADPSYSYPSLKNSKTEGYSLEPKTDVILFSELEKSYRAKHGTKLATGKVKPNNSITLAQSTRYEGLLPKFIHNLTRSLAANLNETEKDEPKTTQKTHVPALAGKFADISADVDFTSYTITGLIPQLNAIVAILLPDDMPTKMLRSDVRQIQQAFSTYSVKTGVNTIRREDHLLNAIFNSIRVRRSGSAYLIISKAAAHKIEKTTADKATDDKKTA